MRADKRERLPEFAIGYPMDILHVVLSGLMVFSGKFRDPFLKFCPWRFAKAAIPPICQVIIKLEFDACPRLAELAFWDERVQDICKFDDYPLLTKIVNPGLSS
jgi:hypothetical protein